MYTLLIVDDEMEIRNGLCDFSWGSLGFTVAGAVGNGQEAFDFVRGRGVDVALCDVRMPILDGLEFAKKIKESELPTKVVLLSGHKDFEYVRRAMQYGCKDYLLKPTKFKQLTEVFLSLKQQLDDEMASSIGGEADYDQDKTNLLVASAQRFIQQNLGKTSLEDVALFLKISPTYLSRIFKEKTGINFSDYFMEQRMLKSKELLKDPRSKTFEVAYKIGYSNPKNFTRAFSAYFGQSPREYRAHISKK